MSCNTIYGPVAGCSVPITLPGSQGATGATGATGADGTSILSNSRARVSDISSTDLQTLKTYTLDNTPTVVLASVGDSLYIETSFSVIAGVSGDLTLEFGALSATLTYSIDTPLLTATEIVLSLFVVCTKSSEEDIRPIIRITGQPDTVWTKPLQTGTQDLTADVIINAKSQKDSPGGAADITCNYLTVLKYEI